MTRSWQYLGSDGSMTILWGCSSRPSASTPSRRSPFRVVPSTSTVPTLCLKALTEGLVHSRKRRGYSAHFVGHICGYITFAPTLEMFTPKATSSEYLPPVRESDDDVLSNVSTPMAQYTRSMKRHRSNSELCSVEGDLRRTSTLLLLLLVRTTLSHQTEMSKKAQRTGTEYLLLRRPAYAGSER